MKLPIQPARHHERGVAVVIVLALLTILMLYIAANMRSLRIMSQEIKLVEQRQLRHWNVNVVTLGPATSTNAMPAAKPAESN